MNSAEPTTGPIESGTTRGRVTLLALAVLSVATYMTRTGLSVLPESLVPWPVHGIALAILVSAPPRWRVRTAFAVMAGVTIGSIAAEGVAARGLSGASLVVAQSLMTMILYDVVGRERSPLAVSGAYVWFMVACVLGALPPTLLAGGVLRFADPILAPGFSVMTWWLGALTSNCVIAPICVALMAPRSVHGRRPSYLGWEFAGLCLVYLVFLISAFTEFGPLAGKVPPIVATLPFLTWAGLRFGVRGYAIVALMLVTVALTASVWNMGPFVADGPGEMFTPGQPTWTFLASLVGPAMLVPVGLSERMLTHDKLRAAHAQLAAIIEGSSDLIAAVDTELALIAANPAWIAAMGRATGRWVAEGARMDVVYREWMPFDAEESIRMWRRALKGEHFTVTRLIGDPAKERHELELTYGPVRDANGELVGASQVGRNVTDRRARESQEAEMRRLESVGRLAGGVAHDFNNLMTAVIGYTELVAATLPADDRRHADLAQIERAASRAGELTQQLLAFARRRIIEPRIVDVGESVHGFTQLVGPLLGRNVTLVVRVEPQLRRVRVDPTQFEQVLMNLAVNARDAMPGGGRLEIVAANAVQDGRKGVRFTVRDNGSGMSEEVQARIWEPFYTTKPLGQGTGLGLPTVYGIVHQAGGVITVDSSPGAGTAFHIFLPEAEGVGA